MKKLLILIGIVLSLSACEEEIDITMYPTPIQNCFNLVYYHEYNCNDSKTILNYCQCIVPKLESINNEIINLQNTNYFFPKDNWLFKASIEGERKAKTKEAVNSCISQTNYILTSTCKSRKEAKLKNSFPETMDLE